MRTASPTHSRHRGRLSVATVALLSLGGLAACGDDESAQDRYCAAGDEFRASLDALLDLELLSGGVPAVSEALDTVRADLTELRETATEAAADEVEALEQAINGIGDSLSDAGTELSIEKVEAVGTAFSDAASAAQEVYATLADC
jgi:HAMP domain-containing protein